MMFSKLLSTGLRQRLAEPGAVVVDRSDLAQLGVRVGDHAWINGQRVRLVAALSGLRALGGVNVLASMDTARSMETPERAGAAGATYFVAGLRDASRAEAVQARLQPAPAFGPAEIWTATEFAERSQRYWLLDTGAGVAVLFMAGIVCLVGAVITSQSLSAVVQSSAREYAMLNALGASVMSLSRVVLEQAFWIGLMGVGVAGVMGALLLSAAAQYDIPVAMNSVVAVGCAALVAGLAAVSGLMATRGLLKADASLLLR